MSGFDFIGPGIVNPSQNNTYGIDRQDTVGVPSDGGGMPPPPSNLPPSGFPRVPPSPVQATPPPVPGSGLPPKPPGLPKVGSRSNPSSPRTASPRSGGLPKVGAQQAGSPPPPVPSATGVFEQKQPEVYRGAPATDQPGHHSHLSNIGLSGLANIIANPADDMRGAENDLHFQTILQQASTGLKMMESMKEVFRKFGKHQKADADKLMDVYERLPQEFLEKDGMEDLGELCDMAHRLILETVQAQKALADFVAGTLVPTMTKYLQEREGRLSWIKKNHQQTEQKYEAAITSMNRAQTSARQATERAKAVDPMKTGTHSQSPAEPKPKKGIFGRFGKREVDADEVYQQAQQAAENYKAAVMTANHEQEQYLKTVSKLKLNCMQLEKERIDELTKFVNRYLARHCQFFNNDRVTTLQTQILSKIEVTNSHSQLENYVQRTVEREGVWQPPPTHNFDLPDFRNIFYSLEDAMNVTLKRNPTARLPMIMTVLINKVVELDGFQTEGIFRISAQQSHLDELRRQLLDGNYSVPFEDPHVPAAMLKDWLRGLNDSLIPTHYYDGCIEMARSGRANPESLGVFVSQLPEVNRECLRYLIHFLGQLIAPANQGFTRMNLENVSIVFAPTLLRCPHDDPTVMMTNSKYEKDFIELLVEMLPTGY